MKEIHKFCCELRLSASVEKKAEEIFKMSKVLLEDKKCPCCGHVINPNKRKTTSIKSIIASSIHLSSILEGERRTQCEVALAVDTTEVTIRIWNKKICGLKEFKKLKFGKKLANSFHWKS